MQVPLTLPLDFLKLLAHDVRWQLLATLAESDRRVQELVVQLRRPQNLVSYHLRLLRQSQLVRERRSSADGRDVYYSIDLDRLRSLFLESGRALHPGLLDAGEQREEPGSGVAPYRVLFLCTHNSARSQLAEGILRTYGGALAEVTSAGSEPGQIHPLAIRAATACGIDISGQRSQHMDAFAGQRFDYVITVCDQVREVCPVFPDEPRQIHWSFADPAAVMGSDKERHQAFLRTARELMTRVGYLRLMLERRQQQEKE